MEESKITLNFLDYLKYERRFSEHTAKCYGADLLQFCEFLGGAAENADTEDMHGSFATNQQGGTTAVATPPAWKTPPGARPNRGAFEGGPPEAPG